MTQQKIYCVFSFFCIWHNYLIQSILSMLITLTKWSKIESNSVLTKNSGLAKSFLITGDRYHPFWSVLLPCWVGKIAADPFFHYTNNLSLDLIPKKLPYSIQNNLPLQARYKIRFGASCCSIHFFGLLIQFKSITVQQLLYKINYNKYLRLYFGAKHVILIFPREISSSTHNWTAKQFSENIDHNCMPFLVEA